MKAVLLYEAEHAIRIRQALDEPDVRMAIKKLLDGNIKAFTDPRNPRGCFIVQGALACGEAADELKHGMTECRLVFTALLRKRITQAIHDGQIAALANASDLARYIAAVSHGIAVQAADGASRAELLRVVKLALAALPRAKA